MNVGIIGGGACGVITALTIKKNNPNIDVTILEQNDRILKKVLKTGNGKCNIANNIITSDMYNDYSLIEKNSEINVIKELMDLGLVLKETTLGRVYPYSEQASSVVNVLLRDLNNLKINIKTNYLVSNIKNNNNKFLINNQDSFDYLVIATGSVAQEKTNGYDLLKAFGHHISVIRPALVPIKVKEKVDSLQGLRIKCDAYVKGRKLSGELLFKNDGLSGILALDLSRLVEIGDEIRLDLMPEYSIDELNNLLKNNKEEMLDGIFAKMITKEILKRGSDTAHIIKNFNFMVSGFYDYNNAQIVRGGVVLNEIDNFQSKIINNLYIGGEVLNVDGASGGYNLYFAWLSGIVIGNEILKTIEEMTK